MAEALLEIAQVSHFFGGLKAVDKLSLKIPRGSLFGLIGPNGAGKTTVFNLMTGVYQPTQGEILWQGKSIARLPCHRIARGGIGRTFQNIRLFKELSVLENVMIAGDFHLNYGPVSAFFQTQKFHLAEREAREKSRELLKIFQLQDRSDNLAGSLPYGDQRKLEIARALASKAQLLLLDEPAAGLNPMETEQLMHTIADIRRKFGITVLLIEHDMKLVMGICERIAVLDHGVKIAEGEPAEIRNNASVIEAYLGKEHD